MEIWNPEVLNNMENKESEVNPATYEELSNKIIL
jgi:hypothetical protein